MGHWHHLGLAVGITALVGCGTPTSDAPVSGHTSGSADAVASLSAGGAPRAGLTAHEPARQAPTQTSSLGPPAQHASTPGARITDAARATGPAHDARSRPPPPQRTHHHPTSVPCRPGAARSPTAVVRRDAGVSERRSSAPGAGTLGAAAERRARSGNLRIPG